MSCVLQINGPAGPVDGDEDDTYNGHNAQEQLQVQQTEHVEHGSAGRQHKYIPTYPRAHTGSKTQHMSGRQDYGNLIDTHTHTRGQERQCAARVALA